MNSYPLTTISELGWQVEAGLQPNSIIVDRRVLGYTARFKSVVCFPADDQPHLPPERAISVVCPDGADRHWAKVLIGSFVGNRLLIALHEQHHRITREGLLSMPIPALDQRHGLRKAIMAREQIVGFSHGKWHQQEMLVAYTYGISTEQALLDMMRPFILVSEVVTLGMRNALRDLERGLIKIEGKG